jgi:RNA polymerase sigma factor (sigma-70 family)
VNTGSLATVTPFPSPPASPGPRDVSSSDPESDAFSGLYRSTITPLRRYLSRFLGNSSEAEEIAHDAYARIYRKAAVKPEALLYTTARRLAINRLKRRSISPVAPTDLGVDTSPARGPSIPEQVVARQEWALLQAAIKTLPPGCREVLHLRKVEQLSHREISERLNIAVSTVEKQHARALRLLRAALPAEIRQTLSSR